MDIAVVVPQAWKVVEAISLDSATTTLGDAGFFLGYPYGLQTPDNSAINNGYPLPLVKKATYSGSDISNGVFTILLDGHNNPGFYGGPIFFRDRTKVNDSSLYLFGVISAYVNQNNQLVTPFGNMSYQENSGIVVAFGTKHIIEIIEAIK